MANNDLEKRTDSSYTHENINYHGSPIEHSSSFEVSSENIPSAEYEIKDGKIFLTNLREFNQDLRLRACVFDTKNGKRLNLGKGENLSPYFSLDEAIQGIDLKGISTDNLQLWVVPVTSSGQEVFKTMDSEK